jgi:hypothetical protein
MLLENFRSKKLLSMAKDAPYCFSCGKSNEGDIVSAHSNQLIDGKGKGIKASDYRIAFLCSKCHNLVDFSSKHSKEERKQLWETAHRATIGWLFNSGRVKIVDPPKYDL